MTTRRPIILALAILLTAAGLAVRPLAGQSAAPHVQDVVRGEPCRSYEARDTYRNDKDLDARDRKRAEVLQHDRIFDIVRIASGMIIGDIGAGDGYFTFMLAAKVGPTGRVYAEDINSRALAIVRERAGKKGLQNVEAVLGTEEDPKLPTNRLDAAFIMLAFHEFDRPVEFLRNLGPSLKTGAKLVIIDPDNNPDQPQFHSRDRQYYLSTFEKSPFTVERADYTTLPIDGDCRMAIYVLSHKGAR